MRERGRAKVEVEGGVARSGKLREAFPLLKQAPRLGTISLGMWLWLIPLRWLSNLAADARLIDPGSFADVGLHILLPVVAVMIAMHLCFAMAHGGGIWAFLWPFLAPLTVSAVLLLLLATFRFVVVALLVIAVVVILVQRGNSLTWFIDTTGRGWQALCRVIKDYLLFLRQIPSTLFWNRCATTVKDFFVSLRLKHHFLLGVKGWVGGMLWLALPTFVLGSAKHTEGGPVLVTLFGGVLMMIVLSWVPFLQAHYAAENRLGAMFELRKIRNLYKNAPFSWMITMLVTLTLSLPMYLFKARLLPSDAVWMEAILFIVTIYPVKVVTGWAYHRAVARERRAFFAFRWITRLALIPFLAVYVFILFFTQFVGEQGKLVLFQHHVFLVPAP